MKTFIEAKVLEVSDLQDPKNPEIKYQVILEDHKQITPTLSGVEFVKAKSLVKPSKIGEVIRFEVKIFNVKDGFSMKTYYRLLKEVK